MLCEYNDTKYANCMLSPA